MKAARVFLPVGVCGKTCFTKKEAECFIRKNEHSRNQYRKEKRAYYCDQCNAWHLTSKDYIEEITEVKILRKYKKRWKKLLNNTI